MIVIALVLSVGLSQQGPAKAAGTSPAATSAAASPADKIVKDWPQWRGPNRDGQAGPVPISTNWPLKVIWQKDNIGKSHSGPVIAEGILVLHYRQDEQEVVRALRADTGEDLWQHAYDQPLPKGTGRSYGDCPRSTPTIAQGVVYTVGYAGKVYATELKTGKVKWSRDLFADYKHDKLTEANLNWGFSASPLVFDGKVILPQGTWAKFMQVALDAASGETAWQAAPNRSPIYSGCYSSAMTLMLGGKTLIASDGRLLWPDGKLLSPVLQNGVATPVISGDILVQAHGPANAETVPYTIAYKLALKDDAVEVTELWKNTVFGTTDATAVLKDGYLYGHCRDVGKPSKLGLKCVELATGKEMWCQDKGFKEHTTVILAGDKLLMLTHGGELVLAEARPDEYKEIARAKILGPTYSHPAIVAGRLYLRDDKQLLCLDLSGQQPTSAPARK